jgi:orotidine 5'-phosphate decarboxylase subfamily 1
MRYLNWMSLNKGFLICLIIIAQPVKTFFERMQQCRHPFAKKLIEIMQEKQTNVCVSLDVTTKAELLRLADLVGPHVCCIKTHVDMITDFDWQLIEMLRILACKHNFLIFEDRKFCDLGVISQQQFAGGLYKIGHWADVVTVHAMAGDGIINAIRQANPECAILLIAQTSYASAFLGQDYAAKVYQLAQSHADMVAGFIAQETFVNDRSWIYFGPGVSQSAKNDSFGQSYRSVESILAAGIDVVVIGRAICQATDPLGAAIEYKNRAWQIYTNHA